MFLRDLQDRIEPVIDGIDTFQTLHSGLLDNYRSTISTRTNAVMRVPAVFSAVRFRWPLLMSRHLSPRGSAHAAFPVQSSGRTVPRLRLIAPRSCFA